MRKKIEEKKRGKGGAASAGRRWRLAGGVVRTSVKNGVVPTCNAEASQNSEPADQKHLKTPKVNIASQHKQITPHLCYSTLPDRRLVGQKTQA